jgi:release factor glutamine methyltransferase
MTEYTYNSLKYTVPPEVYKPSEDTFLLARILEEGQTPGNMLEIGTGCGLLSLIAAKKKSHVIATDINPHAVLTARQNARRNSLDTNIEVLRCDLAAPLPLRPVFDHIIFNPPYLPIEETGKDWISRSWAGGSAGVEFAEHTIDETASMLRHKGDFTFIVSGEDSLQRIQSFVESRRMRLRVKDSASFFFEKIFVVFATYTE